MSWVGLASSINWAYTVSDLLEDVGCFDIAHRLLKSRRNFPLITTELMISCKKVALEGYLVNIDIIKVKDNEYGFDWNGSTTWTTLEDMIAIIKDDLGGKVVMNR
jgi:hypothetical protein